MKEQIFETISKLIEINLQLFKIEIKQEISDWIIQMSIAIIILIFTNMVVVLGSFATAFLLGELFGNIFYGFAIVTIFYLFLIIIILLNRKSIEQTIRKQVQESMVTKQKTLKS